MKYTGISIGPIIDTFSQVRKPRHLWSASYMFSYLMKIIINEGQGLGGELISPAEEKEEFNKNGKKIYSGIGLYPDRAFFKGEFGIQSFISSVIDKFHKEIGIKKESIENYFNIMGVSIDSTEESIAIIELNKKLDILELSNRCEKSKSRDEVLKLISKRKNSILFKEGFGNENFDVPYLALISAKELESKSKKEWEEVKKTIEEYEANNYQDYLDETDFYKQVSQKEELKKHVKSYHKYFCVVQADGDKMGGVIGNLQNGQLNKLSQALITFGEAASNKVKEFGGLPIYAGGDDLLFITPVVSGKGNVFTLIDEIDKLYKSVKNESKSLQKGEDEKKHTTSMSYGISINYYKYPLYEVLESARNLLFDDAKTDRNSIACELRRHSGSSLKFILNKNAEKDAIKLAFEELIKIAVPENMVSATAHKLRENSVLWQSINGDEKRLDAFFKKYMGLGEKENDENMYLTTVKKILGFLTETHSISAETINQYIYSMLRTAKFINGEEVKDE